MGLLRILRISFRSARDLGPAPGVDHEEFTMSGGLDA